MATRETERTGRCMCGAVSFVGRNTPDTLSVCHCRMCRQWTGSALVGVTYKKDDLTWQGVDKITEVQSTPWAKRGFCSLCGSGLYFQFTAEGTYADETEIPLGVFDDQNGFKMRSEIYVDEASDSFGYVDQGHKRLTRAEVIAILPLLDSAP